MSSSYITNREKSPAWVPALNRRRIVRMGAAVAAAAAVPWRVLAAPSTHSIPLTGRIALTDIAGVIYAKPKVNTPPAYSCLFYKRATPTSIAEIYSTAAGTLSGGSPSYYGDWPSSINKTYLDIDLGHFGYTAGQNVAIAFNLDDIVNADSEFRYCFTCTDPNAFNPQAAVTEGGSTSALRWVDGDDFQSGVAPGGGPLDGKTIVFVCPVADSDSFVAFNLGTTAFDKNDPAHVVPTVIDPCIKNRGGPH